jgi:hypothetical protein
MLGKTMANSSRNEAVALNNLGIASLELGDRHQAETHFQAAIGIAWGSIKSTCFKSDETRSPQGPPPAEIRRAHSLFSNTESSSSSCFRTQGLSIPTTSVFSNDPSVDQIICSSIVIFNLALIYHDGGTHGNCAMNEQHLLKARLLYEKSYKLLEGTGFAVLGSFTGDPFVDVLEMSILNNLVHINFELTDYVQSELYRHRLVRSVASTGTIASYYPYDLQLAALLEKERSNCLLNLIVTTRPRNAKAA